MSTDNLFGPGCPRCQQLEKEIGEVFRLRLDNAGKALAEIREREKDGKDALRAFCVGTIARLDMEAAAKTR